ncbi:hypothetical protein LCGC14_2570870 [marine sediment metagenome]|uniref:Uncharacterized protein n=1 Tax=marine sediment metagenome TaxID=412755 RepID=A0A0F9AHR1_9ZZZZ
MNIKGIGETRVNDDGETVLIAETLPPNCVVIFVAEESWEELKSILRIAE